MSLESMTAQNFTLQYYNLTLTSSLRLLVSYIISSTNPEGPQMSPLRRGCRGHGACVLRRHHQIAVCSQRTTLWHRTRWWNVFRGPQWFSCPRQVECGEEITLAVHRPGAGLACSTRFLQLNADTGCH